MPFLDFDGLKEFKATENSTIASVESTTTASKAYNIGDFFWYAGKLYKATAPIASGATITIGTNCSLAPLANDVSALKSAFTNLYEQVLAVEDSSVGTSMTYHSYAQKFEKGKTYRVVFSGENWTAHSSGTYALVMRTTTAAVTGSSNWDSYTVDTFKIVPKIEIGSDHVIAFDLIFKATGDAKYISLSARSGVSTTCDFTVSAILTEIEMDNAETRLDKLESFRFLGDNLIPLSALNDPLADVTYTIDSENNTITVSNGSTATYACIQTQNTFLPSKLIVGHSYRLHVKVIEKSGSPNIQAGIRGVQGNADGMAARMVLNDVNEGSVDFIADSYMKRVSLFMAYGSSTQGSTATFGEIWLEEIYIRGVDEEGRKNLEKTNILINKTHNYIDYKSDFSQSRVKNDSAIDSTVLGYKKDGLIITLNKASTASNAYLRLNGSVTTTKYAATVETWGGTAAVDNLKPGTKYIVKLKKISGEISSNGTCAVNVYKSYTSTNIGIFESITQTDKVVSFIAEEGETYNIVLAITTATVLTDYTVLVTLEEVDEIKGKYRTEMDSTIASIAPLTTEPCLIFPLLTDIHFRSPDNNKNGDQFNDTKNNIAYFMSQVSCDGVICLGDITDGAYNGNFPQTVAAGVPYLNRLMNGMNIDGKPLFFTIGNHDDFRYATRYMYANEIYRYYMRESSLDVVYDNEAFGTNYYVDYPSLKTRIISFDTNKLPTISGKGEYGVSDHTASWVENVLSNMPSDYTALLITHAPVYSELLWATGSAIPGVSTLRTKLVNSGKLCVVFSGHTHFDVSYKATGDVLNIVTACSKCEGTDETTEVETRGGQTAYRWARNAVDETADLWSVVIYKPFSKVLDMVRFGAGVDAHFNLTPISPGTLDSILTGTLTWTSSDADVATVSDGTVEGVASGECEIRATDENGNYESWFVTVT